MIIIGIDPGYAIVGYGVVEYTKNKFRHLAHGAITTPAHMPIELRLAEIYQDMNTLIQGFSPDEMAIEQLFFNTNTKTAIDVAQARGVLMLAMAQRNIPFGQYTPLQVKQSVVGYGRAEKKQVMEMTRIMLNLESAPKPDDAADALAIAICHAHSRTSLLLK